MSNDTTGNDHLADNLATGKAEGDTTASATAHSGPSVSNHRRTRGFTCLFLIEMWERFGFYGMQILIVIFLIQFMGFHDTRANLTWGAFAAMIYTTPIIGGWIGDRILGTRRTTMLGAIVLAIGYLLLALPAARWFIFFSFGVIAVGNGLFKANPNNLLSQLYENDRSKLDSAFTIYYMSINLGAFASQILTPIVRVHWGWHLAFGVSAIGLVLGITNFFFMKKYLSHVGSKPDFEPLSVWRLLAILAGCFVVSVVIALVVYNVTVAKYIVFAAVAMLLGVFAYLISSSGMGERKGLIAVFILILQGLLFFVFYQQMSTSLTLFALRNVQLNFFGYHIPPEQFQVLNPFWIWILSPILAFVYNRLGRRDRDLHIASKFAFGFVMLAVGFLIYGVSRYFATKGIITPWWMITGYFFQSFGELLISGLGLAMVARFVAPRLRGFIMGGWLLTTGISQFFGSMVANAASVPNTIGKLSLGTKGQQAFAALPTSLAGKVRSMNLEIFRDWLDGIKLPENVTAPFAKLPEATQHTLTQLNDGIYHSTLLMYTQLFFILGIVAVGAAIISFALVPYLKRLGDAHASGTDPESAVAPEHERGNQAGGR